MIYCVWFPTAPWPFSDRIGRLWPLYNGVNYCPTLQASDAYCWIVGVLFGAWNFYGYGASVHLAEETNEASEVVAKGMWTGTLATWLLFVTYANNFA